MDNVNQRNQIHNKVNMGRHRHDFGQTWGQSEDATLNSRIPGHDCVTLNGCSRSPAVNKYLHMETKEKYLKGPSQPHLCFCLHVRIWLLYFIRSLSKRRKITVKLLKIIKHTFRNTAYSKIIRIHFTMLYQ